jgi:hypothetical protein
MIDRRGLEGIGWRQEFEIRRVKALLGTDSRMHECNPEMILVKGVCEVYEA